MELQTQAQHAILISSSNCKLIAGVSWWWVRQFAAEHHLPILSVKGRRFVNGAAFLQAIERASSSAEPPTQAQRIARLKEEITQELRGLR